MKRIILPNPSDYINYITDVIMDSYQEDVPTTSETIGTPQIAKILVKEESFILINLSQEET